MADGKKKIAYAHIQFPKLSETFVWREIAALEEMGVEIRNYSLKPPFSDEVNDENARFIDGTTYLPHFLSPAVFLSHIKLFFRKPLVYAGTLLKIMTSRYPPGNWWLAWRKPLIFWRAAHLADIIEKDADIKHIHAHFKYVAILAWIVNRFTGISYSYMAHFATNSLMVGRISADALFVVAASERERRLVERAMPSGSDTPVHLVRLGLPEEYLSGEAGVSRDDVPTIISVGRCIPKKGHGPLLDAMSVLKRRGVEFKAIIVGDGPMLNDLKRLCSESGLDDIVFFAGARTASWIREALDKSRLFALFCTYGPDGDVDGLPVAVMEAMARGLPVVTTRISSLAELVEDGAGGVLVEPDDVEGFADALARLVKDPVGARAMGEKGREKIISEYTLERQAENMKELFDNIKKDGGADAR